ncbi:MAG: prenyltransferase/squalene oxidase repeat-containing protein [Planctomycetota bacterium]
MLVAVTLPLASITGRLASLPPLYLGLWGLLAALAVLLIIFTRTAWGRARPTPRYVLLSLIAHLALFCLATTVRFLSAPEGEEAAAPIKVRIVMRSPPASKVPSEDTPKSEPAEQQRDSVRDEPAPPIRPKPHATPDSTNAGVPSPLSPPEQTPPLPPTQAPPLLPAPPLRTVPAPTQQQAPPESTAANAPIAAAPQRTDSLPTEPTRAKLPDGMQPPAPTAALPPADRTETIAAPAPPSPYTARKADERLKVVQREGGSRATEDAVAAALAWLAAAQSRDGRWDADHWSAGRENHALGHDRRGAGARADTGVTGLALLAMLGAGNSLDEGPFAGSVVSGVGYLLREQALDGGLAGDAALYAQTYCHSMATFALAETLAACEGPQLREAVRAAVKHLVARQDRSGGGWRYHPGDAGDMSQMGWVIMALRSAELAEVDVPLSVWTSIERFVRSTRRGTNGGLASYTPRGPVSRTMTAESLYCRQILGWQVAGSPASVEAVAHLTGRLPGQGRANYYYWYYASLALHHHRHADTNADRAWRDWNQAMSRTLVSTQASGGANAGSWSPDSLWGGYGGRVYATAMATMCLEVYYRYNASEVARDPWVAARPGGRLR